MTESWEGNYLGRYLQVRGDANEYEVERTIARQNKTREHLTNMLAVNQWKRHAQWVTQAFP